MSCHPSPNFSQQNFFRLAEAEPYNFVVDQPFQVKTDPMFPDDPGDLELRSTVFGYRLRRAPATARV